MPTYDVVVAGLGGFGSSAAAHLAARGVRVLGLDPRHGAHAEGSSHGETRIVRQVYFEGTAYVPLLQRTFELWAELSDESGAPLLRRTGGLFLGRQGTRVFGGSLETARHWGLEHEVLDAGEVHARFPALRPPDELWQLVAGFSPNQGRVAYFDLPERMGEFRIHLSLDYGVMQHVDVESSESDVRDAIMGARAGVVFRSHATAEVLGRADHRNPHYYYGTGRCTPKREFWSTPQGKAVKGNWRALEGELIDAFDTKVDEFVKVVDEVLEQRRELKAVVTKVGESLQWAE